MAQIVRDAQARWTIVGPPPGVNTFALRWCTSEGRLTDYDRHPVEPGAKLGRIREHDTYKAAEARVVQLEGTMAEHTDAITAGAAESSIKVRAQRAGIYLAARYSRRKEIQSYIALFEREGFDITSRWLTEDQHVTLGIISPEEAEADPNGDRLNSMTLDDQAAIAAMDLTDIRRADAFVAFTEPAGSTAGQRGGRHVEYGYALGMGKPIVICGHRESFFYMIQRRGVAFVEKPDAAVILLDAWRAKGHLPR